MNEKSADGSSIEHPDDNDCCKCGGGCRRKALGRHVTLHVIGQNDDEPPKPPVSPTVETATTAGAKR